jgi:hypothetical protein
MTRFNGLSQVVQLSERQKADSGTIEKENLEMKKTISTKDLGRNGGLFVWRSMTLVRAILCVAVLAFASVTLFAQTVPGIVTINGGKNIVALHGSSSAEEPVPLIPFYSDFVAGGNPYNCNLGYTVSEAGSSVGAEYTPASQFVSAKTGVTATVRVAVGWAAGANGARVTLDLDCGGTPCGVDTKYLCRGNIGRLPTFGSSCTQVETLKCRAQLVKGRKYWVYVEAPIPPNNTLEGWNLANVAVGTVADSINDGAWVPAANKPLGAFSVQ